MSTLPVRVHPLDFPNLRSFKRRLVDVRPEIPLSMQFDEVIKGLIASKNGRDRHTGENSFSLLDERNKAIIHYIAILKERCLFIWWDGQKLQFTSGWRYDTKKSRLNFEKKLTFFIHLKFEYYAFFRRCEIQLHQFDDKIFRFFFTSSSFEVYSFRNKITRSICLKYCISNVVWRRYSLLYSNLKIFMISFIFSQEIVNVT